MYKTMAQIVGSEPKRLMLYILLRSRTPAVAFQVRCDSGRGWSQDIWEWPTIGGPQSILWFEIPNRMASLSRALFGTRALC